MAEVTSHLSQLTSSNVREARQLSHPLPVPAARAGCPIQAVFWLEWDTTALDQRRYLDRLPTKRLIWKSLAESSPRTDRLYRLRKNALYEGLALYSEGFPSPGSNQKVAVVSRNMVVTCMPLIVLCGTVIDGDSVKTDPPEPKSRALWQWH